jgi:hypothetical protein
VREARLRSTEVAREAAIELVRVRVRVRVRPRP